MPTRKGIDLDGESRARNRFGACRFTRTQINVSTKAGIAIITLGLVATGVWTNLMGYTEYLLPPSVENGLHAYGSDIFQVARLLCGLVFVVCARQIPKIEGNLVAFIAPLMCLASAFVIIAHHQDLIEPWLLADIGFFLSSMGYCMLVWALYNFYIRYMSFLAAAWCVALKFSIAAILTILINLYASPFAQITLIVILPLAICLSYCVGKRLCTFKNINVPKADSSKLLNCATLTIQLFAIAVALVCMKALSNIGIWGQARGAFADVQSASIIEVVIILGTIFILTFLTFHLFATKLNVQLRIIIGLCLMLAALQILVLIEHDGFNEVYDAFTASLEQFGHVMLWVTALALARYTSTPVYRAGGLVWSFIAALWLLWTQVIDRFEIANTSFVMMVIYTLLIIVICTVIVNQLMQKGQNTIGANTSKQMESVYLAFAVRKGLSSRESEVFVYLMFGYKQVEIEDLCKLSSSTVKTHVSRIYKKLNVHSKAEMRESFDLDRQLLQG